MARRAAQDRSRFLAGTVGEYSSVDRTPAGTQASSRTETYIDGELFAEVPLADLVGNPRNPRRRMGDLADLSTIAERQLQPGGHHQGCVADDLSCGRETCRRCSLYRRQREPASGRVEKFGRAGMDVIVRDSIATSSESILEAAIIENIGRRDFDVLEEAEAVEALVAECGSADAAAERLGRSKGWVSQRRALLKLTPELQEKLRAGEIAIRLARSLAQVPFEGQVRAWRVAQERAEKQAAEKGSDDGASAGESTEISSAAATVKAVRSLRSLRKEGAPELLAGALREIYTVDECRSLCDALKQ
ncbi:hypothetical protein GCM10020255_014500 [Rhodococcus baikonurensis]